MQSFGSYSVHTFRRFLFIYIDVLVSDDWNEVKTVASEILVAEFGTDNGNIVVPKKPRISLRGIDILTCVELTL